MTRRHLLLPTLLCAAVLPLSGILTRIPRRSPVPSPQSAIPSDPRLPGYRAVICRLNPELPEESATRISASLLQASDRHEVDPRLMLAMIACESNFEEQAVSRVGALGLGQLMPETAAELGVEDPLDVEENLDGSARLLSGHLRRLTERHGRPRPSAREIHLALACYNAGAGAVRRHGGVPPYRETTRYVKKITRLYYRFAAAEGGLPRHRADA